MTVKIGHSSKDERGKFTGGVAGDQTGAEVCVRNWYNKPWTAVIRPKDPAVAEAMAVAMEQACDNPHIGYDQGQRTTLYTQAKAVGWDLSRIAVNCECDCSSLVAVCVNAAGITVSKSIYSGNLLAVLKATGAFEVLTDARYTGSSNHLRRGDVLLGNGHTGIVLTNGSSAGEAASAPAPVPVTTPKKEGYTLEMRNLKKGCTGEDVKALQILLIGRGYSCGKYGADGDFGSATDTAVRAYQKATCKAVDGVVGKTTMSGLLGV